MLIFKLLDYFTLAKLTGSNVKNVHSFSLPEKPRNNLGALLGAGESQLLGRLVVFAAPRVVGLLAVLEGCGIARRHGELF